MINFTKAVDYAEEEMAKMKEMEPVEGLDNVT
jgi:hypothetical protein